MIAEISLTTLNNANLLFITSLTLGRVTEIAFKVVQLEYDNTWKNHNQHFHIFHHCNFQTMVAGTKAPALPPFRCYYPIPNDMILPSRGCNIVIKLNLRHSPLMPSWGRGHHDPLIFSQVQILLTLFSAIIEDIVSCLLLTSFDNWFCTLVWSKQNYNYMTLCQIFATRLFV